MSAGAGRLFQIRSASRPSLPVRLAIDPVRGPVELSCAMIFARVIPDLKGLL